MTQDKETLREAVREAYLEGFTKERTIMLPDGTPVAHWAGLDAAIATMFERLRSPSDAIGAWLSAALDDPSVCEEMKADIRAWFDTLTAFQQENSDA